MSLRANWPFAKKYNLPQNGRTSFKPYNCASRATLHLMACVCEFCVPFNSIYCIFLLYSPTTSSRLNCCTSNCKHNSELRMPSTDYSFSASIAHMHLRVCKLHYEGNTSYVNEHYESCREVWWLDEWLMDWWTHSVLLLRLLFVESELSCRFNLLYHRRSGNWEQEVKENLKSNLEKLKAFYLVKLAWRWKNFFKMFGDV